MRKLTNSSIRWLVGLLIAALVTINAPDAVAAQNAGSAASPVSSPVAAELPAFAIYPKATGPRTFFNVTQKAGSTASYSVDLVNGSSKTYGAFKGRTFVANVSIRPNGGLDSGYVTEDKSGVTAWFDYSTEIYTIDPGKGIERTFQVTVPKDTKPGQYIAALVFETADSLAIPGTPNLKQTLRQTIAFMITVPGKVTPSFTITDLHVVSDTDWSGLVATITNTGNVLVKPSGTLIISDLNGKPLITSNVSLGTFYAFKRGRLEAGIGGTLPKGQYLVTIDLHDADTGANAVLENQQVETVTQAELAATNAPPVSFGSATGQLKPSADKPQFLNVAATVNNAGDPVAGAELDISAYKDGKLVETYVLVSPLALPKGDTTVSSRYIPADGFSKGAWSFKLSVQVRDPKTGVATVLNTVSLGDPVNIP